MPHITIEKTQKYLIMKIPLRSLKAGRAEISNHSRNVIDTAITEGMRDIEAGRVFGPFKNVRSFKSALKRSSK